MSIVWEDVREGLVWTIKDGTLVKFGTDSWLGECGPLQAFRNIPMYPMEEEIKVCEIVDSNGEWNWLWLRVTLPPLLWFNIAAVKKSAYIKKLSSDVEVNQSIWRCIVKCPELSRVKSFLWLICKNRVLKNEERERKSMASDPDCSICGAAVESLSYILQCVVARETRNNIIKPEQMREFLQLDVGRNHVGRWVMGFMKFIGCCSALDAELWGLFEGLQVAWNMGVRKIKVESDCKEAVDLLNNVPRARDVCSLLPHLGDICNRDWEVSFTFVPRECNSVADKLAKIARSHTLGLVLVQEPRRNVET
ncbi:hypothetical protein F3Y22_tig00116997pilonHSYRG00576 [Hibiscus syriacus]|uniref:RNase H type-1 domain-containing protein n=1 Tax=Hibiscus syriacus TaxID=106335 RepID=A0A6A2XSK1_HIBSY|nr:hypothetical protein F3Y22_tig00116997pilonHSYRG00576 [Hibiscus syriacus]